MLITKKEHKLSYLRNDLTRFMDSHTKQITPGFYNYIYDTPFDHKWAIRYPGATRGHIEVDEHSIIIDIKIYNDDYKTNDIYESDLEEQLTQFIGRKLVIIK